MNERPTDIFISNLLVKENLEPGTEITKLSTVDPDNNQEFVYSIPDTGTLLTKGTPSHTMHLFSFKFYYSIDVLS